MKNSTLPRGFRSVVLKWFYLLDFGSMVNILSMQNEAEMSLKSNIELNLVYLDFY